MRNRCHVSDGARVSPASTEPAAVETVADGVVRITLRLRLGIDHVHCYALQGADGWTLVDAGVGVEDPEALWQPVLDRLDAPIVQIVLTHSHIDHAGGGGDVAHLSGAPVLESPDEYARSLRSWGGERSTAATQAHLAEHGVPDTLVAGMTAELDAFGALAHIALDPDPLEEGMDVSGWLVMHLPGHSDGHLALYRDGILIAGDAVLDPITPTVGLYPESRPDPVDDFIGSLERIVALAPRLALAGHGEPIRSPSARAAAIVEHHRRRLAEAGRALRAAPGVRSAFDVSHDLFPRRLGPTARRLAVTETLAHLEHLALSGAATRTSGGGSTWFGA
jgi:glyoxylase-like metal-dependent hydrolase (beta-lactamase superfamily II)